MPLRDHELLPRIAFWAMAIALAAKNTAYAEPRVSQSHMPILWSITIIGAVLCASIPFLFRKLITPRCPRWILWLASLLLAILFLVFIGSNILVFGAILITGRTM